MYVKDVVVQNQGGLRARPATFFIQKANEFKSSTDLEREALLPLATHKDLVRFGLIPELVGRLPVISPLESLDEESMVKIMTEPKNSVLKQYEQLFNMDGIRLTFEPEALKAIAKLTVERKTGARGLRSIFESTLIDTMYDLPGDKTVSEVIVTEKCVLDGATPKLVKKKSSKSKETVA